MVSRVMADYHFMAVSSAVCLVLMMLGAFVGKLVIIFFAVSTEGVKSSGHKNLIFSIAGYAIGSKT